MPAQTSLTVTHKRPALRRFTVYRPNYIPVFQTNHTIGPSLAQLFNYHNEQSETLLAYSTRDHYYLQFTQKKTAKTQHMPISNQAVDLMGENNTPSTRVFQGLYYCQRRDFLIEWPSNAGIAKHLTFTCLRHTYATL
ncbi:hypothetical protein [Mucilaginibacter rubeus]|uniref:Uncharacterized protein n=1 Tax=Mucilaginibacter rubeus TaxID=2027860 RepID=A0A5C1HWA5_9SPHI|nr:hypothetical protein [Mucilaginibacter rubeus]QEM09088.1 hypothetical protein DEO27_003335 [Mucilaginibacter rubeus]